MNPRSPWKSTQNTERLGNQNGIVPFPSSVQNRKYKGVPNIIHSHDIYPYILTPKVCKFSFLLFNHKILTVLGLPSYRRTSKCLKGTSIKYSQMRQFIKKKLIYTTNLLLFLKEPTFSLSPTTIGCTRRGRSVTGDNGVGVEVEW